jgi:hypothetical protein
VEEEETKDVDKGRDVHERMTQARQLGDAAQEGLPTGMTLHAADEEDVEGEETPIPLVKPAAARKTKQQRRKAQRAREEVKLPIFSQVMHRVNSSINVVYIETNRGREISKTKASCFRVHGQVDAKIAGKIDSLEGEAV